MSAIDLLLRTAIDYERTHQIMLYTLLSKSLFSKILTNGPEARYSILWEPERQLFDLGVAGTEGTTYLELKMWAPLSDHQIRRQTACLKEKKASALYILLGTSWFEHSDDDIVTQSEMTAHRVGYEELLAALDDLIAIGQPPEIYELALVYRNAIQDQYHRVSNSYKSKDDLKLYHYSVYHEIQKRLNGVHTSIFTAINRGGPVYILSNTDRWLEFSGAITKKCGNREEGGVPFRE